MSPADPTFLDPRAAEAFDRLRRHLSPAAALAANFAGSGAIEVRSAGSTVTLSDGREVTDFGSYAVTLIGHRPPDVVAAVKRQLDELPTSTRVFTNEAMPKFADELCTAVNEESMQRVWLGCNGCDAIEAALKLARLATGRSRIIAVEGAFHGKSMGALAATHNPRYRTGLEDLLVGVTHVAPDPLAVAHELARGDVAAFIFEPIQGEGGVRPLDRAFLRAAAELTHDSGSFVISDEVQMGLHRCGPMSLAVEWGVRPDAVVFGKVLGGGVIPLSALVANDALYEPLRRDPFAHTLAFSGHPLACAAGSASLATLSQLAHRVGDLHDEMRDALEPLILEYPDVVREVRGLGLAWGIEFHSVEAAGHVLAELTVNGLVHSPCLGRPEVLRLLPPLVTSSDDIIRASAALRAAFDAAREGTGTSPGSASGADAWTDDAGVAWMRTEPPR